MAIHQDELREQFAAAVRAGNINLAEDLARQLHSVPSEADIYICNITETTWGPVNQWHYMAPVVIPGRKPNERYSTFRITNHTDHMDFGEGKTISVQIPALETATDIVRILNEGVGQDSYMGLFVIADGDTPTEKELREATRKLEAYYKTRIAMADLAHERKQSFDISDLDRRAASYFNLSKPWLTDFREMKDCPVCALRIPATAALCGHCGAVMDAARVDAYRPKPDQTAEPEDEVAAVAAKPDGRTKGARK